MQLERIQHAMMQALELGPGHVPPDTFAGSHAATLRGFAVHANTISHARLVALEETFPKTRTSIGAEHFNLLSRDYVISPEVTREPHTTLGRHFAAHLQATGLESAAALAAFEWAWLESYHAADAVPLALAEFAGLTEEELLVRQVALHPATRLAKPVSEPVLTDEYPEAASAAGIVICRPEAEVRLWPATAAMVRQYEMLAQPVAVCNLLALGDEPDASTDTDQCFAGLCAMLEAGALVAADEAERIKPGNS